MTEADRWSELLQSADRAIDALDQMNRRSADLIREMLAFYDSALEEVVPARPAAETERVERIRRMVTP